MSKPASKASRDFNSLDEALQASLSYNQTEHLDRPDALLAVPSASTLVRLIGVELIEPNPYNPRQFFDPVELRDLADSMMEDTQLQNVLVRPDPTRAGYFQLVFGERRWRAASLPDPKYNNIKQLRCDVRELDDYQLARLAVIENAQRTDMAAIARARGFQTMYDTAQKVGQPRTWDKIASDVGFSGKRSVLRYVQMLDLPEEIKATMERLAWSEKHGRALLTAGTKAPQLAREIERDELSGNAALSRAEQMNGAASVEISAKDSARNSTVTPGTPSAPIEYSIPPGNIEYSIPPGNPANYPAEIRQSGNFSSSQSSASSTRSPSLSDEITSDLREANSRLGRAATALESGTASATLRRDISREMELIEENLERVKKAAL